MINVVVQRGAADKPGDDVQDILLSEDSVALARGTAIIDGGTPAVVMQEECRYKNIHNGNLVSVYSSLQGETFTGKTTSVEHNFANGELLTNLRITRPQ